MNLDRLGRVLRSRWWVLVVVALISLWVADRLTDFRNEQRPTLEALTWVTFLPRLGETDDAPALTRLADAQAIAVDVNASRIAERKHPLAPWELAEIVVDQREFRLDFIGRGDTAAEATDRAQAMLNAYLDEVPVTGPTGLQNQLDELAAEITRLERLIAEATAPAADVPPGEIEFREFASLRGVEAQIAALQARYDALQMELLSPTRPSATIRAEADAVLAQLVTLQLDLQARAKALGLEAGLGRSLLDSITATVDPTIDTGPTVENFEQDIEVGFARIEADQLRLAYQELFLRKTQAEDQRSVADSVVVGASTLDEINPRRNQLIAIAAGLLIAGAGLIIADRVRRPLWAPSDVVGLTPLPEVDSRGWLDALDQPWYPSTVNAGRKAGIQGLRAAVDGLETEGNPVVALVGLGASTRDVQELAADLASSIAISGTTVLLIDASLDAPADLVEFAANGLLPEALLDDGTRQSLDKLLAEQAEDGAALVEYYTAALVDLPEPMPGLRALPAGAIEVNAPDLLARPHFGALLAAARGIADVVLVSGAAAESPITQVLSQRLDHIILVGIAGRTTEAQVEATRREFADRRARIVGLALLMQPHGSFTRWIAARLTEWRVRGEPRKPFSAEPRLVDSAEPGQAAPTDEGAAASPEPAVRPGVVMAAKGVFAAADLFSSTRPGPRLLIYHQIGVDLGRQMEISEELFSRQLDWLQANGDLVDLETALARRGEPEAHRLFSLTFDDGYRDLYEVAYPTLHERGIPFALYLTTDPVETGRALTPGGMAEPLTWEQVNEMLESGLMTLGAHTHTHLDLRGVSSSEIAAELDRSNALIAQRCGVEAAHFAYPKGYWDRRADSLVRTWYRSAALGGGDPVTADTDPYLLHRVPVQKSDGMPFFTRKMQTGMRWEERARRLRSGYRGP